MTYRIGFVVENALGHVTHLANLRTFAAPDREISPAWMPVSYRQADFLEYVPGLPFSLKLSFRARQALRQSERQAPMDAIFIHTQALALMSSDFMARIPTVISLDATPENFRTLAHAYDARPTRGWLARIRHRRFVNTFAGAHGIVAWSDWVKESLIRDYDVGPEKIRVIPSGIDLSLWPAKRTWSPPARPLRILFVGGDFARKGGDLLLRVFREKLCNVCELDIVTKDTSITNEPGVRVHHDLTPNAPALRELYQAADVFALPSRGDATPFSVLEAMACGLPVIATRVGALPEIVRDAVSGFLIDSDDPTMLGDALGRLAANRDLLVEMGQAARRDAVERFDAARNYARLLDWLKQIAAAKQYMRKE